MGSLVQLGLGPGSNPRRYIAVILVVVITLHFVISTKEFGYPNPISHTFSPDISDPQPSQYSISMPSPSSVETSAIPITTIPPQLETATINGTARANATFVMLCRNEDINGVVASVRSIEDRFNSKHNYPWVFLNDEPFTDYFVTRVSVLTNAPIKFGLVSPDMWVQPDWIDEDRAKQGRTKLTTQRVIYGGSVSYRNMCRFNSGFFFKHELLKPFRYYWRVEPDVKFFCDVQEDPFLYMQQHNKVYGFTISLPEIEATISTLWSTVKEFIAIYPQYVRTENAMNFLSDDGGVTYNRCHFWSNFEIADMDFWRGEAYQAFFDYLENKGGFYYERWGDAPVHSIAASLLAHRDQIHFFNNIGYQHERFQHCPTGDEWVKGRCACEADDSFDRHRDSCLGKFEGLFNISE